MAKYWVGVASREHVMGAVEGGFCQFCHGKLSAVRRLSPGEWIAYYSPRRSCRRWPASSGKKDQVRRDESPLFVVDVGGVGFAVGHSPRILRPWHGSGQALAAMIARAYATTRPVIDQAIAELWSIEGLITR